MGKDGKLSTPRLRFPEFLKAPAWDQREVGDIFKVTRGEVLAMPLVKDEKTDVAPYPVYSSQTKNLGLAGYFSEYLYEDAITWTTDGANAGDVKYRLGKFYCTNVCGVLLSEKGYANPCTAALIDSVARQYVSYVGNPKLMNGVMARIPIPFPPIAEQQKIADCLTSLDEVIAAQGRKVAALADHKRGLMQQLFPREGETLPRRRFPEFRDAGEWTIQPLSELISSLDAGVSVNAGGRQAAEAEIGVLKTSCVNGGAFNPTENKVVLDAEEVERVRQRVTADTILIVRKNTEALVGSYAYVASGIENLYLPDLLWVATPSERAHMRFVAYTLGTDLGRKGFARLARGTSGSMKGISKPDVLGLKVPAPTLSEQQRIAACLSALDARIAGESEKLDALKTHKKGLMQQLFPVGAA